MNESTHIFPNGPARPLPNATAVLILGIMSIPGCCCYGAIGLILGVIALVLASKDKRLYYAYPGTYTEGSYNNLKAGRICAIIGIVFSSLYAIAFIIMIATMGVGILTDPEAMQEVLRQYQ